MSSKTVEEAWREWLNNTFPSDVLEFDDGDMHASFIAGAAHGRAEGAAEEHGGLDKAIAYLEWFTKGHEYKWIYSAAISTQLNIRFIWRTAASLVCHCVKPKPKILFYYVHCLRCGGILKVLR